MEGIKVEFDENVISYLSNLVDVLFEKEYFSYKENAYAYVDAIIDEINNYIHLYSKKKATNSFVRKYGSDLYYSNLKKNKRTSWVVYFNYNKSDSVYKIRYISNNHVSEHNLRGVKK